MSSRTVDEAGKHWPTRRPTPTTTDSTRRLPTCGRTIRWRGSTTGPTGRSGPSPSTKTSWRIERANDLFLSEPRPLLATAETDDVLKAQQEAGMGIRTLIHMDDPHHRKVRAIGADWFRPKAMRAQGAGRRTRQPLRRHDA